MRLLRGWGRWVLHHLDDESVRPFQLMYYLIFTALAVNLMIPGVPLQDAEPILKPSLYWGWVGLNLICPPMTLLGRWLTSRAALTQAGEPNSAIGGAWLQLGGDLGVWGSVDLWVFSMFATGWWPHNLYVPYFLSMGVLGGGMFTFRSFRRLLQIRQWERA